MNAAAELCNHKMLSSFVPLNRLDADKCSELAQKSVLRQYKSNDQIYKSQDEINHLFFLVSGTLEILQGTKKTRLKAGSAEAASQLSILDKSNTKVICKNQVSILVVNHDLLDLLLNWDNGTGYEVDEISSEEEGDWLQDILQNPALLKLSPSNIQAIMACIETLHVKAGQEIIKQGTRDRYYYIISKGRCRVTQKIASNGKEKVIAELSEGDSFGEEALIIDTTRNATITMLEDGLLLRLDHSDFSQFLKTQMVRYISPEQAHNYVLEGAQWIDVRSPDEHVRNGIGLNMPLSSTRVIANELNKHRTYILYCTDGCKSSVAAFLLRQRGLEVYVVEGGLNKNNFLQKISHPEHHDEVGNLVYFKTDERSTDKKNIQEPINEYTNRIKFLESELSRLQAKTSQVRVIEETKAVESLHRQHKHELELYTQVNNDLSAQLKQQKIKISTLEKILARNEKDITEHIKCADQQKGELKEKSDVLQRQEQCIASLEKKLRAQQKAIDSLRHAQDQQTQQEDKLKSIIENLEKHLASEKEHSASLTLENSEIRETLKLKEVIIHELSAQIETHLSTINNSASLTETLKAEIVSLKERNALDKTEITHKENEVTKLKNEYVALHDAHQREIHNLVDRHEQMLSQVEQANDTEKSRLEALLAEKNQENQQHIDNIKELENQIHHLQTKMETSNTKHDEDLKKLTSLEALQKELITLKDTITVLSNEKAQAQQRIEQLSNTLTEHQHTLNDKNKKKFSLLDKQISTLKEKLAASRKEADSNKQQARHVKTQLDELTQRAELAERTVEVLEFQLTRQQLENKATA